MPLLLVATVAGCATSDLDAVRSLASHDLKCPKDKIEITRVDNGHSERRGKGKYRADGCGATERYVCDDWDSYAQTPACHPGGEWSETP
jgi:hypothetical protein